MHVSILVWRRNVLLKWMSQSSPFTMLQFTLWKSLWVHELNFFEEKVNSKMQSHITDGVLATNKHSVYKVSVVFSQQRGYHVL